MNFDPFSGERVQHHVRNDVEYTYVRIALAA